MSSGSSATQSSTSGPTTVYGPRSFLVLAIGCTVFGLFFWYLYGQLNPTSASNANSTVVQDDRPKSKTAIESTDDSAAQIAKLQAALDELKEQLGTYRIESSSERIDQDRQLARLAELRRLGDVIGQNLQSLKKEFAAWEVQTTSLRTNEIGKRIAADEAQLVLFASIVARQPTSAQRIANWEEQHARLFSTVRSMAVNADAIAIPEGFLADVNALDDAINRALNDLRQKQAAINGIVAGLGSARPGSDTQALEIALAIYTNKLAKEREELLTTEANRIRDEFTARLAEEKRRTERELGEAALANEKRLRDQRLKKDAALAQIEIQKAKDQEEDARRAETKRQSDLVAKREREDLEKEFEADMAKIKHYLIPFITEGYSQPPFVNQGRNTGKKGPVSLSALQKAGCFGEGIEGLRKLGLMAWTDGNDRPGGGFTRSFGDQLAPKDVPFAQTAQDLLKKYGQLMVEKGMLAQ